jgi:alkaline phosphatase
MTQKALGRLSRDPSRGFFLMVEGASIDKQAHRRNPCGQIGELSALDRAVAVGREFAQQHPGTLIIVTADHGQASQVVPLPEDYLALTKSLKSPQYPPGYYAVLKTRHGELMAVGYATNAPPHGGWEQHTGVDVPVFLEGIDGREVPALMSQWNIFRLMQAHLQLP